MAIGGYDFFKSTILGSQARAPIPPSQYVIADHLRRQPYSLVDMIFMRLYRDEQDTPAPFDFINAYLITPERVVVFLVVNGEPQMLEDGALFPSDTLITQLRLLIK
jgi:hypothetical protein